MALVPSLTTLTNGTTADATQVMANLNMLRTGVNAVDAANIGTDLPDTVLQSPNNTVYRTVLRGAAGINGSTGGATFWFAAGTGLTALNSSLPPTILRVQASDYAVTGKTAQLSIEGMCVVNSAGPGVSFILALVPIGAASGATGGITYTTAPAVGNAVTFASPAAGSITRTAGADFAFPADGFYLPTCTISGTTAAASYVHIYTHIRVRHT